MLQNSILDSLGKAFKTFGKRGQRLDRRIPYMVVWNFTNMCNLKCKHCYQDAKAQATRDELSLEEKLSLVDTLHRAGVKVPVISGGEPLIHPDFWPVLDRMVSHGMYAAAASNATMITPQLARRLKESGLSYIEISLDSVHAEKHDEFRGAAGAWEKTVNGIKSCIDAGIFTAVATVFTKNTLDEVDKMIDFAASLGAQRFIHFNFCPTGRGLGIKEQDLSPEEREMVLTKLYKRRRTAKLEVLSTAPQFGRVCLEQVLGPGLKQGVLYVETRTERASRFYVESPSHFSMIKDKEAASVPPASIKGCGAGRQFCCIQPNGHVTPCMFIPSWVTGNIREEPFETIWRKMGEEPCFIERDILEENCGSCQFRYVCGGCRARAINYIKNPFAADSGCIRNKDKWLKEQGL